MGNEGWATELTCVSCGHQFAFSESEQAYYRSRNFTPPKRCKPCREEAKRRKAEHVQVEHAPLSDEDIEDIREMFDDVIEHMGIKATVTSTPDEETGGTKLVIEAADSANKGMLIGHEGWIANSLRAIAFCTSKASGHTFTLEIIGPDREANGATR